MIGLKDRLSRFYRFLKYGERSACKEFTSYLVECQDVYTSQIYDCSECGFMLLCYQSQDPRFMAYLKRNDAYKDEACKIMDDIDTYLEETRLLIENLRNERRKTQ